VEVSVIVNCQFSDQLVEYIVEDGISFSQFIHGIQSEGGVGRGMPQTLKKFPLMGVFNCLVRLNNQLYKN
jgi:hypothetical protein